MVAGDADVHPSADPATCLLDAVVVAVVVAVVAVVVAAVAEEIHRDDYNIISDPDGLKLRENSLFFPVIGSLTKALTKATEKETET